VSAATTRSSPRGGNRLLEVLAVALLGVATIGSAWCGYQATRWNGDENDLARQSSALQVEAARQFGLATQTVSYDTNMLAQYANAAAADNARLKQFYRDTLIRPDLLPLLDRWEQQVAAGSSPPNLLEDREYLDAQLSSFRETQARAEEVSVQAQEAGNEADDYVLTTLILASALFFAGLTTSFRVRFARLLLLVGASLLIAYAAARLVDLNVA
jgi:hypothetical protein